MVGLERGTVSLEPYSDTWRERYAEKASRLEAIADDRIDEMAHIGSTAIEGMPAKPIIDMLAVVDEFAVAEELVSILESNGYEFRPDPVDDRLFLVKGSPSNRTHYLSLTEAGSSFHRKTITFRDHLRTHPRDADRYAELKRRLANAYPENRDRYTAEKDAFIQGILDCALSE